MLHGRLKPLARHERPGRKVGAVDEAAVIAHVDHSIPFVRILRRDPLLDVRIVLDSGQGRPRDGERDTAAVALGPEPLVAVGVEFLLGLGDAEIPLRIIGRGVPGGELAVPDARQPVGDAAAGSAIRETVYLDLEHVLAVVREDGRGEIPLLIIVHTAVADVAAALGAEEAFRLGGRMLVAREVVLGRRCDELGLDRVWHDEVEDAHGTVCVPAYCARASVNAKRELGRRHLELEVN